MDTFSYKIACFPTPPLFDAVKRRNLLHYQQNLYIAEKYIVGYNFVADIMGLSLWI